MPAVIPETAVRNGVGLVAIGCVACIRQARRTTGEVQVWRAPVDRVLIGPGNSGEPGNVQAAGKERRRLSGQAAELVSERRREALRRPNGPVDVRVDPKAARPVQETKDVRSVAVRRLHRKLTENGVPLIDALVDLRLDRILMGNV